MTMRGEFIPIWPETWDEIWMPVRRKGAKSEGFYTELFREIRPALNFNMMPGVLAEVLADEDLCESEFKSLSNDSFYDEGHLIGFLESVYWVLTDLGGETLGHFYYESLDNFIQKYSLRYVLQRPCSLCPSLPGLFSSLMLELQNVANGDVNQKGLLEEFENAVKDLRLDCSETRIKTCIQKQINLLESIGQTYPGVTETKLGGMCDQIKSWPHAAVRKSLKNLYGFASDYPGIRHGCKSIGVTRSMDKRDVIALLITLAGYTPYLSERINTDAVYGGIKK